MRRAGLVVGLWLLTASPSLGTTLLWMDVQELTTKSTSVVIGRALSQRLLTAGPGVPLNQISFEIARTLKGDLQGTIVVNNPGFPGAPVFNKGEELILFIYTRNDTHVLTGFQQGSFKIVTRATGSSTARCPHGRNLLPDTVPWTGSFPKSWMRPSRGQP